MRSLRWWEASAQLNCDCWMHHFKSGRKMLPSRLTLGCGHSSTEVSVVPYEVNLPTLLIASVNSVLQASPTWMMLLKDYG